jgi:hypothetical protein
LEIDWFRGRPNRHRDRIWAHVLGFCEFRERNESTSRADQGRALPAAWSKKLSDFLSYIFDKQNGEVTASLSAIRKAFHLVIFFVARNACEQVLNRRARRACALAVQRIQLYDFLFVLIRLLIGGVISLIVQVLRSVPGGHFFVGLERLRAGAP